jgi:hypothetical protein
VRLSKRQQRALDALDCPCRAGEIDSHFMPNVRVVFGHLPEPCFDSVATVAAALAGRHGDGEIPTGHGAACVRHFNRRNEQLGSILSVESRFALLGLASLANIAGGWACSPAPRLTQALHKECLGHAVMRAETTHVEQEHWRKVVAFLLASRDSTPIIIRKVAYALTWCGYFSPDGAVTDDYLAQRFFGVHRERFIRFRQEALALLAMLREFSLSELRVSSSHVGTPPVPASQPPVGGIP